MGREAERQTETARSKGNFPIQLLLLLFVVVCVVVVVVAAVGCGGGVCGTAGALRSSKKSITQR